MKQAVLFLITLCIQSVGFAETQQSFFCYSASEFISEYVPQTFCFESISFDQENKIIIQGANLEGIFPISSKNQDREGRLILTTNRNFVDVVESDCSHAEQANLILTATFEQNIIDPSNLQIQVLYSATSDNCHSIPTTKWIDYRYNQP
jgi:hypothetical protein